MKLAVSSLAWAPSDDADVRALLTRKHVVAIEVAPLKYWPGAPAVDGRTLSEFRSRWAEAGIEIVALQAILFGMPELQLFGTPEQQVAIERHLVGMIEVASHLGARVIVLGAPKNRLRGAVGFEEAIVSCAPLLRRVAVTAAGRDCSICIEANPPRYGGDFVCTLAEGIRLVEAVDHPGFGLHLDAGATAINGESDDAIVEAARIARHFHVSEIDLVPVGSGTVDHDRLAGLLSRGGYGGALSIEMRPSADVLGSIETAIDVACTTYGGQL